MLDNIPKNRLLMYGMLLSLLPLFFVILYFFNHNSKLNELSSAIRQTKEDVFLLDKKQSINKAIIQHYKQADHFYIDKQLETLTFLEPETEALKKMVNNKNYAFDDSVKKRLDFLTNQNRFNLIEGVVQSHPFFQETVETLAHPVEVNEDDILELLSRIEGAALGPFKPTSQPPQLIITDFKLDRKAHSEKNETYLLSLKLLKREFP